MRHLLITIVLLTGCLLAADAPTSAPANRDDLIGWYRLPSQDRETRKVREGPGQLIPVLKRGEEYFSVCRGIETPFSPSAEGLEWASTPSSMRGTTIGRDPATGDYWIKIVDRQLMHNDDWYDPSEKRPLVRAVQPPRYSDPREPAPTTNAHFVGSYVPLYFPFLRYDVSERDGKFFVVGNMWEEEKGWKPHDYSGAGDEKQLKPLEGTLGLDFDAKNQMKLTYSKPLTRYEFIMGGSLAMPLRRVDGEYTPPRTGEPVGIPSWH